MSNNRYLVVKAKGGMGNRMLCAVTGVLYGQVTGKKTIIDWRDGSYSNDGSNTFSQFFDCSGVYPETILPNDATVNPAIWDGHLDKSMNEMISRFDPEKHSSIRIHRKYSIDVRRLDYDEDIVIFWYYTGRTEKLKKLLHEGLEGYERLDSNGIIRKVLTEKMLLHADIRRRIEEFKAKRWPKKVIGVHIRYTDRKTNLAKYEKQLNRFLKQFPDAHIFLATDNQEVGCRYREKYDNVFSTPKWFPEGMASMHQNTGCPDKIENGIEALVDMYLLAECDCLIYSGYSTFSLISRILSDAKPKNIVDIDRFNIKVQLKKNIRELLA